MASNSIFHQTSCPHTPQQNNVVEFKKRHLLETNRTILLHSEVLFWFWKDVVPTAIYLINLTIQSLSNILIQSIFPLPPSNSSTCFVYNRFSLRQHPTKISVEHYHEKVESGWFQWEVDIFYLAIPFYWGVQGFEIDWTNIHEHYHFI